MSRLTRNERARILHLLVRGQSIRAVTRLTGASKNTVIKLLVDAGRAMPVRSLCTRCVTPSCAHPSTLKVSPAVAAGVTDRLWEMTDLVEMIEAFEAAQKRAE